MFQKIAQRRATRSAIPQNGDINVAPGFADLEARFRDLDKILARLHRNRLRQKKPTSRQLAKTLEQVRATVELTRVEAPELIERLRQHLSIHGVLSELPTTELEQALGQLPVHNAYFWRLLARAYENRRILPLSCLAWEQFRAHALAEGWFSITDFRAATIDLRMAGQLVPLSPRDLATVQTMAESSLAIILQLYRGQSETIRALAPSRRQNPLALYPNQLCQRAAGISSIRRLVETALDNAAPELAYQLLADAFKTEDTDLPRLLALRALSLPPWTPVRILECLHVAVELARRQDNAHLISEILTTARPQPAMDSMAGLRTFINSLSEIPLSEDELTTILKREQGAISYPVSPDDDVTFDDDWDNEMDFDSTCSCEQCQERRQHSPVTTVEQGPAASTWLEVDPGRPLISLLSKEAP